MRIQALGGALLALLSATQPAAAVHTCGSSAADVANSTYAWTISDWKYVAGPDPDNGNVPTAAVSGYLTPGRTGNLYSCFAQWIEPWAGRFQGGSQLIWNDCMWTGPNGNTEEDGVVRHRLEDPRRSTWGTHLPARTLRDRGIAPNPFCCLSTYNLPPSSTVMVATGSTDHRRGLHGHGPVCSPPASTKQDKYQLSTRQQPTPATPAESSSSPPCADPSPRYQSWRIDNFARRYSVAGDSPVPVADTGPYFTLRNMASGGVFNCTSTIAGALDVRVAPDNKEEKRRGPRHRRHMHAGHSHSLDGRVSASIAGLGMLELTQRWPAAVARSRKHLRSPHA